MQGDKVNFGGELPQAGLTTNPAPFTAAPPACAREIPPPSAHAPTSSKLPRLEFCKPWMRERARICARIFKCLGRGQSRKSLFGHLRLHAGHFAGRCYKSDPGRRIRLSPKRLWQLYRAWERDGEAALWPRQSTPRLKVGPGEVARLLAVCWDGAQSLRAAYGRLDKPVATYAGYRWALGPELREAIGQVFKARRKVRTVESRAAQIALGRFPGCPTSGASARLTAVV